MAALVAGLRQNKTIQELKLRSIELGDEGCFSLAPLLLVKTFPLHKLDLSKNQIGNLGCRIIAFSLEEKKSTLRELDLGQNNVADEGACTLFNKLQRNKYLHYLRLYGNDKVGSAWGTGQALSSMLRQNTALKWLSLPTNILHKPWDRRLIESALLNAQNVPDKACKLSAIRTLLSGKSTINS